MPRRADRELSAFQLSYAAKAKAVEDAIKKGKDQVNAEYPKVTAEMLDRMLRPVFDQDWSEEEETELETAWQAEAEWAQIDGLTTQGHVANLQSLANTATRFNQCLPTDIISRRYNLEYDASNKPNAQHGTVLWASDFCKAFNRILMHPMWRRLNVHVLVMVIQFAVIVRTDDRRGWKLQNPTTDKFIDGLVEELKSEAAVNRMPHDRRPVSTMLRDASNRVAVPGIEVAESEYQQLFSGIVSAHKPTGYRVEGSFEDVPYRVTTGDITAIENALNGMGLIRGSPAAATAAMHRDVVMEAINTKDSAVSGPAAVKDFLKRSGLKQRRDKVILGRVREREREEALQRQADEMAHQGLRRQALGEPSRYNGRGGHSFRGPSVPSSWEPGSIGGGNPGGSIYESNPGGDNSEQSFEGGQAVHSEINLDEVDEAVAQSGFTGPELRTADNVALASHLRYRTITSDCRGPRRARMGPTPVMDTANIYAP